MGLLTLFKKKQVIETAPVKKEKPITAEEKAIIEKYKDKIYCEYITILGRQHYINLRTVKAIAKEAGLVKPKPCYVSRDTMDNELTGDSYTDNSIIINSEMYDFYGERKNEVLSLYRFSKWIASLYDNNGDYNPK